MISTILITFIFGGILLLISFRRYWNYAQLPQGPKGLPFFGNAFQVDPEHPYLTWFTWAEKYGEMFTMWNFGRPTVLCNSFKAAWEMLVSKSNDFAGRPQSYVSVYCTDNAINVIQPDFSPSWAHRKKTFMTSLKMYGEGIKRLEDLMVDIIAELIDDMGAAKEEPFDPKEYFELALANTLSLLLLGHKFERNDADFKELLQFSEQSRQVFSQSVAVFAYNTFPWLHYLPLPFSKLLTKYRNDFLKEWMPRMIQRAKVYYDQNNCTCVLHSILKQQEIDRETGNNHSLKDCHITGIGSDFIIAGLSTSTGFLYALFAILTAKQDIQTKAREEVDQVLKGQRPTLKDRESMPYFQAMMEEVLRYAVIVPTCVLHKATTDSNICGHFIPKDTELVVNNWFLCHDANFWEEPDTFKPERFLDNKGELLAIDHPRRKRVLIFGAGRRVCPGEQLAKNRIFLITTSLLQKFIFKQASDHQIPVYDSSMYKLGGVIMPHPYSVKAIPRA